jgi:hypothetical protein
MARPYQKANIPGPEMGTSVTDPAVMANFLKSPMKKVLVIKPYEESTCHWSRIIKLGT